MSKYSGTGILSSLNMLQKQLLLVKIFNLMIKYSQIFNIQTAGKDQATLVY